MYTYFFLLFPVSYVLYKYVFSEPYTPSKGRKMGILERYYDFMHNYVRYQCFVLCATLNGNPISDDELIEVLMRVSKKHPLISCCINYDQKIPHFIPIDNLKNKIIIKRHTRLSNESWRNIADKEMNCSFKPNEPLFRINILYSKEDSKWDLLLSLHHAIFDGRAGASFLKSILEEYDSINDKFNGEELPLPPPVENVVDVTPTASTIFGTIKDIIFPSLKKKSQAWVYPENMILKKIEERSTSTIYFSIDSKTVSLLRDKCRFYKTTITCALFTAISHAIIDALGEDKKVLSFVSPFDLRNFSDPTLHSSTIGAYVSPSEFELLIEKSNDFWSDASLFKQNLNLNFKDGLQAVGMIKYGLLFDSLALKARLNNSPNGRLMTVSISNLGCVKFQEKYNNCTFNDVWFTQLKIGDGATFNFSSITSENGNMNITLNFLDDPAITQIADLICPKVQKILTNKATE